MSQDDAKSREERRRKIRELEASLFGASTIDSIKVMTIVIVDYFKKRPWFLSTVKKYTVFPGFGQA